MKTNNAYAHTFAVLLCTLAATFLGTACPYAPETETTCEADLFRGNPPPDQCVAGDGSSGGYQRGSCTATASDPDGDCATSEDERRLCRVWPNGQDPAYDNRVSPFNGDTFGDGIDSDCGGTDGYDNTNGSSSGGSSGQNSSGGTSSGNPTGNCGTGQNLVRNPDFNIGTSDWFLEDHLGGGSMRVENGELRCQSGADGILDDDVMCRTNVPLTQNQGYRLEFCTHASSTREMKVQIRRSVDPWTAYGFYMAGHPTSQSYQCFGYDFVANGTDGAAQLVFMVGKTTDAIWIDQVRLCRR